jgi:hypothetical protein
MMKQTTVFIAMIAGLSALAQPPGLIDYQCRIDIDDTAFDGTGYFKLAISDAGNTNAWTHNGTSVGITTAPGGCITNAVNSGIFSLMLGDTTLGMSALTSDLFTSDLRYLRVWFSTNADSAFTEMLPAQRLASVPYALNTGGLGSAAVAAVDDFASAAQGRKADTALQADGTVGLTGDLNLDGNRIVNVSLPQHDGDAVSKSYLWTSLADIPARGGLSMGTYTNR